MAYLRPSVFIRPDGDHGVAVPKSAKPQARASVAQWRRWRVREHAARVTCGVSSFADRQAAQRIEPAGTAQVAALTVHAEEGILHEAGVLPQRGALAPAQPR